MKNKKIEIKKIAKGRIRLVLLGLFALAMLVGIKVYKDQKVVAKGKYLMERQRDLMIESWKEEGLTEAEIKARMDLIRQKREEAGRSKSEEGMGMMKMGRMMK